MTPLVVTMSFLLLLAVVLGLAVIAAYTGLLEGRVPELSDRLAMVAKILNGDEQVETGAGR